MSVEEIVAALGPTAVTPRIAVDYAIQALARRETDLVGYWLDRAQSLLGVDPTEDDPSVDHEVPA